AVEDGPDRNGRQFLRAGRPLAARSAGHGTRARSSWRGSALATTVRDADHRGSRRRDRSQTRFIPARADQNSRGSGDEAWTGGDSRIERRRGRAAARGDAGSGLDLMGNRTVADSDAQGAGDQTRSSPAKRRALLREILQRPGTAPRVAPMSFAQRRLWFLDQLVPGNPFYNVDSAIRLRGSLQLSALVRSLSEIVTRHGALRTTFALVAGQPVQLVHPLLNLSV